ncbi:MAG: YlxR family protein [Lachnospiraceae bacterium]|nr:YlxR family protein [Lachnospiraceae bacterium]
MAKKVSLRQCVGCGEMKDKKEMMRVLKSAEGIVSLDMTGRKNGRGAYLCKNGECLVKARRNKGLERSFKMRIPDEIYANLEKEFEEGRHEADTGEG